MQNRTTLPIETVTSFVSIYSGYFYSASSSPLLSADANVLIWLPVTCMCSFCMLKMLMTNKVLVPSSSPLLSTDANVLIWLPVTCMCSFCMLKMLMTNKVLVHSFVPMCLFSDFMKFHNVAKNRKVSFIIDLKILNS